LLFELLLCEPLYLLVVAEHLDMKLMSELLLAAPLLEQLTY
jgi:hypothetical protein